MLPPQPLITCNLLYVSIDLSVKDISCEWSVQYWIFCDLLILLNVFEVHVVARVNMLVLLMAKRGEGNGTPLQYSCLEDPMDGGAWKAAVHGIAEMGSLRVGHD